MIGKFVSGNYGLARTCWVGLLTFVGVTVVSPRVRPDGPEWVWDIHRVFELNNVYFVLMCVVSVSIWQAAGKYEGWPVWALLAKATVVLYWAGRIASNAHLYYVIL